VDWTIVASILVALLLWVLSLALIAAAIFALAFTVLRGRSERMAERMMDTCREHFEGMMDRSEAKRQVLPPMG
jgi:hypothetical protein